MGIREFIQAAMRRKGGEPATDAEWGEASALHPTAARIAADAGMGATHRGLADRFLAEKQFLGPVREAPPRMDRVRAAFNAALPFIGIGPGYWRGWKTVFLLPGAIIDRVTVESEGVVREYDDELSGQVREFGSVLLSLPDLGDSGRGTGYNVAVHEMAHKIDGADGSVDGCPPLDSEERRAFVRARDAAFADFARRAAAGARGGMRRSRGMSRARLPMDEYGAEDEAEFFAVSAEAFFDRPAPIGRDYPEWYAALAGFFGLDPLGFTRRGPVDTMAGGPAFPPERFRG